MVRAYIGLGSNQGNRICHLRRALSSLHAMTGVAVKRVSHVYETAPWGHREQRDFLNGVVAIDTCLSPSDLLKGLKRLESQQSRRIQKRWGPRSLDIDILAYGNRCVVKKTLKIPHPHLSSRKFVLEPFSEIDINWKHPSTGKTVRDMLEALSDDTLKVRRLKQRL